MCRFIQYPLLVENEKAANKNAGGSSLKMLSLITI